MAGANEVSNALALISAGCAAAESPRSCAFGACRAGQAREAVAGAHRRSNRGVVRGGVLTLVLAATGFGRPV